MSFNPCQTLQTLLSCSHLLQFAFSKLKFSDTTSNSAETHFVQCSQHFAGYIKIFFPINNEHTTVQTRNYLSEADITNNLFNQSIVFSVTNQWRARDSFLMVSNIRGIHGNYQSCEARAKYNCVLMSFPPPAPKYILNNPQRAERPVLVEFSFNVRFNKL